MALQPSLSTVGVQVHAYPVELVLSVCHLVRSADLLCTWVRVLDALRLCSTCALTDNTQVFCARVDNKYFLVFWLPQRFASGLRLNCCTKQHCLMLQRGQEQPVFLKVKCCSVDLLIKPAALLSHQAAAVMGNPIFEPESEQDEQSSRDYCRHPSRRRLDLARNPFRVPPSISPSDRRRAQVTRTSYRGDTFTIRGAIYTQVIEV